MLPFFALLLTLTAAFSYLNVRVLRLPAGILFMLLGTVAAVGVLVVGQFSPAFVAATRLTLARLDFPELLLGNVLSFLLFAGSLHIKYAALRAAARSILAFATVGVVISTLLGGAAAYFLLQLVGLPIPLLPCLVFGAMLAPTDPVAVLGIVKETRLSPVVETNLVGESLFNDGVGVVIFSTLLILALPTGAPPTAGAIGLLLLREVGGGLLAGLAIGYVGYRLMKSIDHFQTEILITLSMVVGGYALCHALHVSGPLAMVVAGVFTGNSAREEAMSVQTQDYLIKFWEVLDDVLNALLFVLMGLELVVVGVQGTYLLLGAGVAVALLAARYVALWVPATLLGLRRTLPPRSLEILTWGGLRGGISLALALALPRHLYPAVFVPMTLAVVLFSLLVQGLTLGRVITRLVGR
jgi:monovalent cation:H+ antiporter, CPA1 family